MNSIVSLLEQIARDIDVTRYLSAAGYTILLYDATLTFSDEVTMIWPSPWGMAKWTIILNKYVVIAILTFVNFGMSGLSGINFSNSVLHLRHLDYLLTRPIFLLESCHAWLAIPIVFSTLSLQVSNAMVLLRVMALWEQRFFINAVLFCTWIMTTVASVTTLSVGLGRVLPEVSYISEFRFCGFSSNASGHFMSAVWGIPFLFDLLAMTMTALNALDKPRSLNSKVSSILANDGLFYFIGISLVRLFNVLVIALAPPSLIFLGGYFSWAIVTTTVGRFLISLRRSELTEDERVFEERPATPFGIPLSPIAIQKETNRKMSITSNMSQDASATPYGFNSFIHI